jgi:arsenical pump membrane protein
MANAASLLLPGSNLTNLLVLQNDPQSGAAFAGKMLPAWLAACAITAAFVLIAFPLEGGRRAPAEDPPVHIGPGAAAIVLAALLVIALPDPALPVLALGLAAVGLRRLRPRLDPRMLALLFALTVGLGTLARLWHDPARLLDGRAMWAVAGIGATAPVLLNNLPAAVLLSSQAPAHQDALLLGLDLGPNLAITGSLSAVLWLQAARLVDARASIVTYTRLGIVLVPLSLTTTLAALVATRP